MTSICFDYCFNKSKFKIDFECVSTCYNKYLFSMKKIRSVVEDDGRKYYSEHVKNSLGEEKRNRFMDEVFPLGGHPIAPMAAGGPILKRKFFESYHFSDPLRTGR